MDFHNVNIITKWDTKINLCHNNLNASGTLSNLLINQSRENLIATISGTSGDPHHFPSDDFSSDQIQLIADYL